MLKNYPKVSIITVNFRQNLTTLEFLKSIFSITYPNFEVLVVDNGSLTYPAEFVTQYPDIKLIVSRENRGFAGGNNLAVKESTGEYLLFINNDTEVEKGFLEPLVERAVSSPDVGMVSPKIIFFHDKKTIQYAGYTALNPMTMRNKTIGAGQTDNGNFDKACPTAYAHGAAMLVPGKVIEAAGTMDESFFLYYEELDWAIRIKKAGFTIWYEPQSVVYHKESVSTGRNSPLKTYYMNRNRIRLLRIHFKPLQVLTGLIYLYSVALVKNMIIFLVKGEKENMKSLLKAYGLLKQKLC
ncbi:MAG TPA: glycosyltransferase family 2 protein [Bacteroidia bacterium]|nr:glycosyltransferase family 2 protein [Bacteroidia bacterium]HRS58822.1 glycosyltransferase family 2 protein [Bacteroidia bacterium]HRU67747.1 glycosyltransferase family 2 protein [Bacteroidia bacterium]